MDGPATLMVLTTGDGVDGFTLDPTSGEFVRSHHRIRIPTRGRIYSVNEGNFAKWEPGVQRYIRHLRTPDVPTGRPYTARYVGSLVADFHRTLLESRDRKSTRLNSSHVRISYAVFCLKKKNQLNPPRQ